MEGVRERRRGILGSLAAIVPLVLLCVACGSDDVASGGITPEPADLNGGIYQSTDVTGHDLVSGSMITLSFTSEKLAVRAGCSTQAADYEVTDETLRWNGPAAATRKACSQELEEQDRWLSGLFTEGVTASLDDSTLTLDSGDVTIVLESAS